MCCIWNWEPQDLFMQPYLANHNNYATVKLGLNVLVMLSYAWSIFLEHFSYKFIYYLRYGVGDKVFESASKWNFVLFHLIRARLFERNNVCCLVNTKNRARAKQDKTTLKRRLNVNNVSIQRELRLNSHNSISAISGNIEHILIPNAMILQ